MAYPKDLIPRTYRSAALFQLSKTTLVVLSVALSLCLMVAVVKGIWSASTSSAEDYQLIVSCDEFEDLLDGRKIPCGDFFHNMSSKLEYTGIEGYEASFHELSQDGLVMVFSFEAEAGNLFALRNSLMETSYEFHLADAEEKACLVIGCDRDDICDTDEESDSCLPSRIRLSPLPYWLKD